VTAASGRSDSYRYLAICLGIAATLQVVTVNYWPGFPSPNERGRAYQAMAIADRGRLSIDAEVARFGAMEDIAAVGGRLYPNKAPGVTPLVVPAALVARLVAGGSDAELRWTLTLGRLLASSLPHLLTAVLLAGYLRGVEGNGAVVGVVAYACASPALAASLLLLSHELAAFLLFAAFTLLHSRARPELWRAALAGLLIGWSVTAEYPALVPGAVLALLAVPRLRARGSLALAAGGALPALALAAYNQACFGAPLALSSGREADQAFVELARHGLFGVGWPTFSGLCGLLASPARGLLVWSPIVVLGAAGLTRRKGGDRDTRATLVLVPLALLVAMSGYPNWHGGWFPGPRYLLAVFPFIFALVGRGAAAISGLRAVRVLAAAAALWGAAVTFLSLASFPFPPEDYPLPAVTFSLRLLRVGILFPSWLPAPAEAAVVAALFASMACLLLRTIVPRLVVSDIIAAAVLAASALGTACALPPPPTWQARLEWAVVRDLYAGPPRRGALEALEPFCETMMQRAQLQRWLAQRDLSLGASSVPPPLPPPQ
jgi:hypothetical protein